MQLEVSLELCSTLLLLVCEFWQPANMSPWQKKDFVRPCCPKKNFLVTKDKLLKWDLILLWPSNNILQETVILNCIFHTPKAEYIYLLCPMKLLFLLYDNMSKVQFILYLAYGVLAELYLLFGGNSGLRTSEYKWLQWELFNSKFIYLAASTDCYKSTEENKTNNIAYQYGTTTTQKSFSTTTRTFINKSKTRRNY